MLVVGRTNFHLHFQKNYVQQKLLEKNNRVKVVVGEKIDQAFSTIQVLCLDQHPSPPRKKWAVPKYLDVRLTYLT